MNIIKIIDGFITNSSSVSTTIIVALKKGICLEEILKKMELCPDTKEYFADWPRLPLEERLQVEIEEGYLDPNIYELQQFYDILLAFITDEEYDEEVGHREFRKIFWDQLTDYAPLRLVEEDFILLHSIESYLLPYRKDLKKEIVKVFIEKLLISCQNEENKL